MADTVENSPIQLVQVVTATVVSLPDLMVARQQIFLPTTLHLLSLQQHKQATVLAANICNTFLNSMGKAYH